MSIGWEAPEAFLVGLEIAPGIPKHAARKLLTVAVRHYALDPSIVRPPQAWQQILSKFVCRDWQDPRKRSAALALDELPGHGQVGGFHEGPVHAIPVPASFRATDESSAPPEAALELARRLREPPPAPPRPAGDPRVAGASQADVDRAGAPFESSDAQGAQGFRRGS